MVPASLCICAQQTKKNRFVSSNKISRFICYNNYACPCTMQCLSLNIKCPIHSPAVFHKISSRQGLLIVWAFPAAHRWWGAKSWLHCPTFCGKRGVQDTFIDKLSDDGWTIELFSMAAPTMDKFDDELKEILGDLFDITTAVQRSALRLAWSRCQASQSPPSTVEASPVPSLSDGATAQSSWSETFPPKLTSQVVNEDETEF